MQIDKLIRPVNPTGKFRGTARYLGQLDGIGTLIHVAELSPRIFNLPVESIETGMRDGSYEEVAEPEAEGMAPVDLSKSADKHFARVKTAFSPFFGPGGRDALLPKSSRVLAIGRIARKAKCSGRHARRLLYTFLASGGKQSSLVQRLHNRGTGTQQPPEPPSTGPDERAPFTPRQQRLSLAKTFEAELKAAAHSVASGEMSIDSAWTKLAAETWAKISPTPDAQIDLSQVLSKRQLRYQSDRLIEKRRRELAPNRRSYERAPEDSLPEVGFRFEIDATYSQVEVVSQLDRSIVLPPVTGYGTIDVGSTVIVGASLSMHKPSWIACQRALFNTFREGLNKSPRVC